VKIRWPSWAEKISVRVNGKAQKIHGSPQSYVTLDREWRDGDRLEIQLPLRLRLELLPNTTNTVAVLCGPIVLAGELGTNAMPSPYARNQTDLVKVPDPAVPVLIGDTNSILKHIEATSRPLVFQTRKLGQPEDVMLIPFYQMHHERYSVYWKVVSPADWKKQAVASADSNSK
jgi:uncharacterized protein